MRILFRSVCFPVAALIICLGLVASVQAEATDPQAMTITTQTQAGNTETAIGEIISTAQLHGKIMELGSPDPLRNALVVVVGITRSAESNDKGFYSLTTEPGNLQVRFSAAGHAPVLKNVQLEPGQDLKLNAYLDRVDFASAAVVVRGKKDKPQTITTTLSRTEIKKIPGSAGDALRAIQSLPGIAVPNDFSGQLAVQGGGTGDNLYLLDNIPWPFPFHFGGLLSTVNSDLLTSVDLNAAGFGVRWGDRMGAVLDAKTRAGQKDRLHVSADVNLVTSQGLIEGPLGIGDASFTLSGRRSYFDLILGKFLGDAFTAFPYFWDLGGSLDFSIDRNNHIRAMVLGNDDILGVNIKTDQIEDPDFAGEFKLDNSAFTSGFSWINTATPDLTSTLTPYYYQTKQSISIGNGFNLDNRQYVFGLKQEAEWKAGDWLGVKHEVGFGGGVESKQFQNLVYFFKSSTNGVPTDLTSTTVTARSINRSAYVMDRVQLIPEVAVTAGLHYDKNDKIAVDVLLPRFSLEWQYDKQTLWKAAWGRYAQFPGGMQINPDFGNPKLSANRAEHSVLSLEKKFSREFTGRVDVYYKQYRDLVVSDSASVNYANNGLGIAKGVELFLRQDWGEKFFGWISYAYSKSERLSSANEGWQLYQYDQPNILTLVANYSFTPAWSIGTKVHYNSGPLETSLKSRYQDAKGIWRGIFSDTYDLRLEDYLRLDLRMDYSWRYEGWRLNVYLEILNLLNRANPAGITYNRDYSETIVINNLPLMPYFGMEVQF